MPSQRRNEGNADFLRHDPPDRKKNPWVRMDPRIAPCFLDPWGAGRNASRRRRSQCLVGGRHGSQAGLLAPGSSYSLRLPTRRTGSGSMQVSSPVTAAGPRRTCTGFPFQPGGHLSAKAILRRSSAEVKKNPVAVASPLLPVRRRPLGRQGGLEPAPPFRGNRQMRSLRREANEAPWGSPVTVPWGEVRHGGQGSSPSLSPRPALVRPAACSWSFPLSPSLGVFTALFPGPGVSSPSPSPWPPPRPAPHSYGTDRWGRWKAPTPSLFATPQAGAPTTGSCTR